MKKRGCLFISMLTVLCLLAFSFAGCGRDSEEGTKQTNIEKSGPGSENPVSDEENGAETESGPSSVEEPETRNVTIYYVDGETAEIAEKNVEIKDEYDIWENLKESGILTEGCELLSLNVDQSEKKIDMDFNTATGDWIRSMGTTGETQIIGCIINTYLEAYGCDGIRLQEEGQPLQTSHGANYDGYSGKITF